MRVVTVKYLTRDKRTGHYLYRRRVPGALHGLTSKREFLKVLGKTEAEAVAAYGTFHREVEQMATLARLGVEGLTPTQQRDRLAALLRAWGADPHGPGKDANERTWRVVAADSLLDPYQDDSTGQYRGVPDAVAAEASALLTGVDPRTPGPTITDAFRFYLRERGKPIPEQRTKQEQRLKRVEVSLIAAAGADKALADLTREDARRWRDMRIEAGVSSATVRREKNDISAVIALAISELGSGEVNPFSRLKMPAAANARHEERKGLPPEVVRGVYANLARDQTLLAIWTLMDLTGARPSEVSGLLIEEFIITGPVPYIIIRERKDRTLKSSWSIREVPLVGPALEAAQRIAARGDAPKSPAFPQYASKGGMDRLSAALTRRVRKFTDDPKHVPYSLRHTMKDRLRAAEVSEQVQRALLGHAMGTGEERNYGGALPLQVKRDGLLKALSLPREGPSK
jgi:integrase